MKTIINTKEDTCRSVADYIEQFVIDKPDARIAFAGGRSTAAVYKLLSSDKKADFSKVEAFLVSDYVKPEPETKSIYSQLKAELFDPLGIVNIHTPDPEAPEAYDETIASLGGLDIVVLGIGLNGHIGFNEPATLYDTLTHTQLLTDSTKRMKAADFGSAELVPQYGVTMGLKTICSAENVVLVAFGEEKAEIVHKLVYGKTTTYVPAAMLQMHMNMSLYLDKEAASKLD